MLRHRFCRRSLSNTRCSTGLCVSLPRVEHCGPYCKSTFKPLPLPATKSSNGTLGTKPSRVSARAMMTSFSMGNRQAFKRGRRPFDILNIGDGKLRYPCVNWHCKGDVRIIRHKLSPIPKPGIVGQQMSSLFSSIQVRSMPLSLIFFTSSWGCGRA